MRWVMLLALLCGCASQRGLKLVDVKDGQRAAWAEPKTTFQPSESFLAHIRGYGGRKITLELWRCGTNGDVLIYQASHTIPARKTYRSYDGLVFDTRGRNVILAEQESFYWTGTDYVLRFKPLAPGVYELRLQSDNDQRDSVRFTVAGYR